MKPRVADAVPKLHTHIPDFDLIAQGGLPRNRSTLLSRKPTFVRPPITNRRATNPCRRHRDTVRVETL